MPAETSPPTERGANSEGLVPQKHGGALKPGGNPGGRPAIKRETIEAIRKGLPKVIAALIAKAEKGDSKAIELCLHYGIGKPTDKLEVSGPDGSPISYQQAFDDHERRALRDAIRRASEMAPEPVLAGGTEES